MKAVYVVEDECESNKEDDEGEGNSHASVVTIVECRSLRGFVMIADCRLPDWFLVFGLRASKTFTDQTSKANRRSKSRPKTKDQRPVWHSAIGNPSQVCLMITLSIMFATFSQRSIAASSFSYTSFHFSTVSGSFSSWKSSAIAA